MHQPDDHPAGGPENLPDPEAGPRALRAFFAEHNRRALLLALLSCVASAVLWAITYVLVYWFSLIAATLARSFNANTLLEVNDPNLVGPRFPLWFIGGAIVALMFAAALRGKAHAAKLREGRHYLLWVVLEILLAIPNVTFSIWGNLSAITHLRRREATAAWQLLSRIDREGGRLNIVNLRQEVIDEKTLQRIVFGLQIVGLIDMREQQQQGWFLCLHNRAAYDALSSRFATGA